VEDDSSSPRHRSLLALAGSMLVEINLLKLALAAVIMIVLPAILLGLAPLLATGWYALLSRRFATLLTGFVPIISLILVLAVAWFGGRPLFRATERSFWSLTSLVVQPGYVIFREGLRHFAERQAPAGTSPRARARLRALATASAGLLLIALALLAIYLVWPATRWEGNLADLRSPQRLIAPTLANSVVVVGSFLAAASLVWSLADAWMEQPRDLTVFDEAVPDAPAWRVAHLSDLHAVGSRYEFRLESGRAGPRGNDRMHRALARLAEVHAQDPVDIVLMSGDMTDGGRSTEWAEFFDALEAHPALAERTLILPGNHDLNVVDRSNPARLELPTGTGKCLREMRMLSAMAAVQGDKVRVMDRETGRFTRTLNAALAPHREAMRSFADNGSFLLSLRLGRLWDDLFPLVLPPRRTGGLGVIILNSNAETHFSFTNALGLVPAVQAHDLVEATHQFPEGRWIIALHHHLVEYPSSVASFSARIGTALINGSWFVRQLRPLGRRIVAMHGHRHLDWIGAYGDTRIISAPSPVMSAGDAARFYIQQFSSGPDGSLLLLPPERVDVGPMAEEASARLPE
jgi:predicted MPP superfamily phosphohydrolase